MSEKQKMQENVERLLGEWETSTGNGKGNGNSVNEIVFLKTQVVA